VYAVVALCVLGLLLGFGTSKLSCGVSAMRWQKFYELLVNTQPLQPRTFRFCDFTYTRRQAHLSVGRRNVGAPQMIIGCEKLC